MHRLVVCVDLSQQRNCNHIQMMRSLEIEIVVAVVGRQQLQHQVVVGTTTFNNRNHVCGRLHWAAACR